MTETISVELEREEVKALSLASVFGGPDKPHAQLESARAKLRAALASLKEGKG